MSAQAQQAVTRQANRVAAIQMVSTHDIAENLREAGRLLEEAASFGAGIAVLPENFAILATRQMIGCGRREADPDNLIRHFLAEQSARLGLWIVGGSLPIASRPDGSTVKDRVRACCLVYNDEGEEVARYDKIHLFDAMVEDAHGQYRESDTFEPGDDVVVIDTPAGRLGLAICYVSASPNCSGSCGNRAPNGYPCPAPLPGTPAMPTGMRSCEPGLSRTSSGWWQQGRVARTVSADTPMATA